MYTQCPDCDTVFKVTAEALRSAQGMVRCGICSSGFNALENLSEQPVARPAGEDSGEDTMTVEEMPGTEFIELSGSAVSDSVDDDSPAAADEAAAAGADALDAIPDTALEFHGSSEDLERLFVQAGPSDDLTDAIGRVASADFSGIDVHEQELPWPRTGPGSFDANDPGHVAAILALPTIVRGAADDEAESGDGPDDEPDSGAPTGEYPVLDLDAQDDEDDEEAADEATRDEAAAPVLLIPEELRRGPSRSAAEELADIPGLEDRSGPRRWPLAVAAVFLALMLLAQAVHHWREDLARDPVAGPWVLRAYGMLGLDLSMPADLAAFELRQLGAASEPNQAGRIKVRASIVNRAAFAQPYPLLRLTLQDRFGSTIGVRDLGPAEYLPGGEQDASGLLGPSERADAEVVFVDPGQDAVGFELDVCLRGATGLRCSTDLPRAGQ